MTPPESKRLIKSAAGGSKPAFSNSTTNMQFWKDWDQQIAVQFGLVVNHRPLHYLVLGFCLKVRIQAKMWKSQNCLLSIMFICFIYQVQRGFRAVHISGLELQYMGQQTMGHYPVHFHMNGDVDEKGGYSPPTFVSDLSIHHSFSRCVTIHGSNGLLVSLKVFSLHFHYKTNIDEQEQMKYLKYVNILDLISWCSIF